MAQAEIIKFNDYYNQRFNAEIKLFSEKKTRKDTAKTRKRAYYIEDMKQLQDFMQYLLDNKRYLHHLIFNIEMGTGRRIGDLIGYKDKVTRERLSDGLLWESFYNSNGERRKYLYIDEQKTNKHKDILIGDGVWDAIEIYCKNTGCEPCGKNKDDSISLQLSGTHKGKILSYEGYRLGLKDAAKAVGIEVNIASHTARKQAGTIMDLLHPEDSTIDVISSWYGHSSKAVTENYMGHRQRQENELVSDLGKAQSALLRGEEILFPDKPLNLISIEYNHLRDIIQMAYDAGIESANNADYKIHRDNMDLIMEMIRDVMK